MSNHRHQARRIFVGLSVLVPAGLVCFHLYPLFWVALPLIAVGYNDLFQKKQTIRRNFPVLGNFRYLFELIRPEINQYFVESNIDGKPFSRERRSLIYQRSKGVTDTVPFGTQQNVYAANYEWVNHSLAPKGTLTEEPRVKIGGKDCRQPYLASLFNISAMSYGSLSRTAVLALNRGAKRGGFYHNTGEGGLSPYHLEPGGDLVWQIGTGYFSTRGPDGRFSEEAFRVRAILPQVKMIEIKLSQGAKPGHGGILPASKVTKEISEIRAVPMGEDVISPSAHTAFDSPEGLLHFVKRLRDLSGGKPVGFKLCVGKKREFFAIVKAMLSTGIRPDFITVDGGEGGTGAAPLEFSNSVGTPLSEGLVFVHNALVGAGVRDEIRLIASGSITSGFAILTKMALGADLCNSARGMMFALGCIQALRCNNNTCPTGVATQDPSLYKGLDVGDKSVRVAHFQKATVHSFLEVLGAAGLRHPREIRPWHIQRRISSTEVRHYGELFDFLPPGALLADPVPTGYARAWTQAVPESWDVVPTAVRDHRSESRAER
jgi:glutamate synthase domain-containing protein 2